MGRIKTQLTKRMTHRLIAAHRDALKETFEENKKLVDQFMTVPTKKIRNAIAGYVTKLMKRKEDFY